MKFFLDTASLAQIRHWQSFGLVDGVTTNPALLAREGGDPLDQLRQVAELVEGPVSAQVTFAQAARMIPQAHELARVAPNVVVKVPATQEGHRAARELVAAEVPINVTLTFQPAQAIPFARLGVDYVSLILGRVEDFGLECEAVKRTRTMLERLGTKTKLLVASIRNPTHLCDAVAQGADVLTVPPATWALTFENPLSLQGQEDFQRAWLELSEEHRFAYEHLGVTS